ncbi:MAG: DUF1566 domain-containing protein [bacterium]|nr:DUF1566 domain-containing protein [bacterium]
MNKALNKFIIIITSLPAFILGLGTFATASTFEVVDTSQSDCFDTSGVISCPTPGTSFYGQDATYHGQQPNYTLSSDNLTVLDIVTGLTWLVSPDTDGDGILESPEDKLSWWDAMDHPATLNANNFGGFNDWRVPTIKELYSLMDFRGIDPSGYEGNTSGLIPFIDTDFFSFEYGNEGADERIIDSQYWSSNEYVSTTMNGDHTVFGVNFADGRIKGYGTSLHGNDKVSFVLCCRGNTDYGVNDFVDNGDGTVTDTASGLMWQQSDSGYGMTWEDGLAHAENLVIAGHDDWRLPNAKELQIILDYNRSPSTDGSAAIDPLFSCTAITDEGGNQNFPSYWTGTTHANWTSSPGEAAAYICFGEALGWMRSPFPPFNYSLMDVHGAGSQRSDPKIGDPSDWPYGRGPQGDVIRIYNFVRCVRNATTVSGVGDEVPGNRSEIRMQCAPNPFNPTTTIAFSVPESGPVELSIFNLAGHNIRTLVNTVMDSGEHSIHWDGRSRKALTMPSGTYFARLKSGTETKVIKMILAK